MATIDILASFAAVGLGIAHALYLYRREIALFRSTFQDHSTEVRFRAAYYALWALALWVLLGPYIVWYWLLAMVPFLIARAMGKTLTPPRVQTNR
jgi:hypothetical protein